MAKQAIKKKGANEFSISGLKKQLGMSVESVQDIEMTNTDKPLEWIVLPKAYEEATHLPGIPMGYLSGVMGWSDTGKSTLKNIIIASCIKQGIMPVIFETEGNFDFKHAIDCGMVASPIYGDIEEVDQETGEVTVTQRIITYDGDFLYFDNNLLCQLYGNRDYGTGTEKKTFRKVALIEDIAFCINSLLDMQDEGQIQKPICFIWDSIGSIISWKSYNSKTGNPMFDAGALSNAFNVILNTRIPSSRKMNSEYTNTMFVVNKIWNDGMNSMGGIPSLELKGGKSFYFAMRLLIHVGGAVKAATKKLKATLKGQDYRYGMTTKIKVVKNHLPTPWNLTYEGEVSCVHNGIISPNELEAYKKTYIPEIIARLKELHIGDSLVNDATIDDVEFSVDENESDD